MDFLAMNSEGYDFAGWVDVRNILHLKTFYSLVIICVSLHLATSGHAQSYSRSVVIGTMANRPNALLVLNPPGSNQGFLLPQLTSAERIAIRPSSPEEDGLLVFDISEKEFYYWKNNQWSKKFGNEGQSLSYNAATRELTLSNGNTIDLTPLKEVPVQAGNGGKLLTTNGSELSWVTVASLNELPAQAGNGGKILSTNGTVASWINQTQELPTQTGNAGKALITNGTTASWSSEFPNQAGNAGKILSTNGTNVLWTAIPQGLPSQTGNTGKVLTTDGTNATWTNASSIAATQQSLGIDPSDFFGVANDKPDKHNEIIFEDNSTFISIHKKGDGSMIMAPFHLPDGAVIQQIQLYYTDRDPQNFTLNIYRRPYAGSNENIVSTWTSTGNSSSIQIATLSPIAGRDTIDNEVYTYRIVLDLNPTNDANNASEATHRIYGVKVKFLK